MPTTVSGGNPGVPSPVVPEAVPDEAPSLAPATAGRPAGEAPALQPVEAGVEPAPLWLRRTDQGVVALLVLCGLILLTAQLWRTGGFSGEVVEIERLPETLAQYRLLVNRATWVEWAQLDGIGETLARRIVEDRDANGPFRSLEDLSRVRGIGPKTLDSLRHWLVFD